MGRIVGGTSPTSASETSNGWSFPLDYRYREIYRNRDQAENIEDGAEPTHVSLDVLSAVVVDPCGQLVREDIDGC